MAAFTYDYITREFEGYRFLVEETEAEDRLVGYITPRGRMRRLGEPFYGMPATPNEVKDWLLFERGLKVA